MLNSPVHLNTSTSLHYIEEEASKVALQNHFSSDNDS
jgi:hypothetical protein